MIFWHVIVLVYYLVVIAFVVVCSKCLRHEMQKTQSEDWVFQVRTHTGLVPVHPCAHVLYHSPASPSLHWGGACVRYSQEEVCEAACESTEISVSSVFVMWHPLCSFKELMSWSTSGWRKRPEKERWKWGQLGPKISEILKLSLHEMSKLV